MVVVRVVLTALLLGRGEVCAPEDGNVQQGEEAFAGVDNDNDGDDNDGDGDGNDDDDDDTRV